MTEKDNYQNNDLNDTENYNPKENVQVIDVSIYFSKKLWVQYLSSPAILPRIQEFDFSLKIDNLMTELELSPPGTPIERWYCYLHGDALNNYYSQDSPIFQEKKKDLDRRRFILIATIVRHYLPIKDIQPSGELIKTFRDAHSPSFETSKVSLTYLEWIYLYRFAKSLIHLQKLVSEHRNKELFVVVGSLLEGSGKLYCRGGAASSARKHRESIFNELFAENTKLGNVSVAVEKYRLDKCLDSQKHPNVAELVMKRRSQLLDHIGNSYSHAASLDSTSPMNGAPSNLKAESRKRRIDEVLDTSDGTVDGDDCE